jgi:hypothetical protein
MDIAIVEKLMSEPREALVQVVGEDAALFPALVRAFPEIGSHEGRTFHLGEKGGRKGALPHAHCGSMGQDNVPL